MAALLLYLGYALMYLATVDMVSSHYVAMGFYFLFAGLGSSAGYQAGLITNIRNFTPKLRGIVTGLLAAAFGLSAAVFTKIYGSFWKETAAVDQFLWFLAVCLGLLPLVGYLAVYLVSIRPLIGCSQHTSCLPPHNPHWVKNRGCWKARPKRHRKTRSQLPSMAKSLAFK